MVHKKYIKRGDKIFGPYLYENYRENGVTKTRYFGLAEKEKKVRVNKSLFVLFAFILILILVSSGIFWFLLESNAFSEIRELRGRLSSEKYVSVSVQLMTDVPVIYIDKEIFVCENTALSHFFNVRDNQGAALDFKVEPQTHIPFRLTPSSSAEGESLPPGVDVEIFTPRRLIKEDVNHPSAIKNPGENWATYQETISAVDSVDLRVGFANTNITVIEVNNAPNLTDVGAHTIWTQGEDGVFYYEVQVEDKEDSRQSNGKLTFNLTFLDSGVMPFFEINKTGVMNLTGDDYFIDGGEISKVYNLKVCVNDTGLTNPHSEINRCLPDGDSLPLLNCSDFSLTITKENRKPNITSYNPIDLNFSRGGSNVLYFNATANDSDWTPVDFYWYVGNDTIKYTSGVEAEGFDEFKYSFGCGAEGNYTVRLNVSDGLLYDVIQWNITVVYEECALPGGGPGGGGGGGLYCIEKWACDDWNQCQNFKTTLDKGNKKFCEDKTSPYRIIDEVFCRDYLNESDKGSCAFYQNPETEEIYVCPSYERKGNPVMGFDCSCYSSGGNCDDSVYNDVFNFSNGFFISKSGCNPKTKTCTEACDGIFIEVTEKWDYQEIEVLDDKLQLLIKERCGLFEYDDEICGFQTRECFDFNYCGTNLSRPGIISECYFTVEPNCTDNIKNCHDEGCEILIDCGGPCEACPTCYDGILNQDEEKVDCGGVCSPCKEIPFKPILVKTIISYSLIGLLILIVILVIMQILKYSKYKKAAEKEAIKEKIKKSKFEKKKYSLLVFVFAVIVLLVFANMFILNIANADRVVLRAEEGFLGTRSLMNTIIKGFAEFFMTNVVLTITEGNAYLEIWEEPETNRYTHPTVFDTYGRNPKSVEEYMIYFYANYTQDVSLIPITDSEGSCGISFGEDNFAMTYNPGTLLWEYSRDFNYRKNIGFDVTCDSDYGNPFIPNTIQLDNTPPCVFGSIFGCGGTLPQKNCYEDSPCSYNFGAEVMDDDFDDMVLLSVQDSEEKSDSGDLNPRLDGGVLNLDITKNKDTGIFNLVFLAEDEESSTSASKTFNIIPVNDAPEFVNLENKTFNETELFSYNISVVDEENDYPFSFIIEYLSCKPAEWSSRIGTGPEGGDNCDLLGAEGINYILDNYGGINISFIPDRNDVGVYEINFTVIDSGIIEPVNAIKSVVVNFTVTVINQASVFTYMCDNERSAVEDKEHFCWISVSDVDEVNNITFTSDVLDYDLEWFLFNDSQENSVVSECGIETGFIATTLVNFTPTDLAVGQWEIMINATDTGEPIKSNLTSIDFFVDNVPDSPILYDIDNFVGYVGNDYVDIIGINASDEDLFIPISRVVIYDEDLSFQVTDLDDVPISGLSIRKSTTVGNLTKAYLSFSTKASNPLYLDSGIYNVKVKVTDNSELIAEKTFAIDIQSNNPPEWDDSFIYGFERDEDEWFYLDLYSDLYVVDPDPEDILIFSFVNGFPNFSLSSEGVIDSTPKDEDVGFWEVKITATDTKTPASRLFNFTINNINDAPSIRSPLEGNPSSIIDGDSNVNVMEDNKAEIMLWVEDEDFKISQKSFYDEKLILDLDIEGVNKNLFDFVRDPFYPDAGKNLSKYDAIFTPIKSDVGTYNVSVTITDNSGATDVLMFNLTVTEVNHPPVLMNLTDYGAKVDEEFFLDINATDLEDGNDDSGLMSFSYDFLPDGDDDFISGDPSIFNTLNGKLTYTFISTGKYHINITVTDSSNLKDYKDFWIYVYDTPIISYPIDCSWNLKENVTSELTFRASHTAGDNLTYEFYLEDDIKERLSYYGAGVDLVWNFAPNFTDETYDGSKNLTLLVYPFIFNELNATKLCNVTINHTNAPVIFNGDIGDKSTTYRNRIAIDLKQYFEDIDAFDEYWNQNVSFTVESNSSPSYIGSLVENWTLILSALADISFLELLNITAYDLNETDFLTNATSNNFIIEFTTPATDIISVPTPSPSPGGGGATSETIIALKIIVPGPVSAYEYDRIEIPLSLLNNGQKSFIDLNLSSSAYKDGDITNEVKTSLDKTYLKELKPKQEENLILTVFLDTDKIGDYEVLVEVESKSPRYSDWGKIHINLQRLNESEVRELIVFTEEYIAAKPECIEINEVVDEAEKYFEKGDFVNAKLKTREALYACKDAVSQASMPKKRDRFFSVSLYLVLAVLSAFVLGLVYYFLKRRQLQKLKSKSEKEG